jgi:hypothetical protein
MSLPSDESSENLFLQDTFQDALRHLFFLGLEYLHIEKGMEARLLSRNSSSVLWSADVENTP